METTMWKARAAELRRAGYAPGNPWERELHGSLLRAQPRLVAELGSDLPHYVQVIAAQALAMFDRLTGQGTPPDVARELVREEFLTA